MELGCAEIEFVKNKTKLNCTEPGTTYSHLFSILSIWRRVGDGPWSDWLRVFVLLDLIGFGSGLGLVRLASGRDKGWSELAYVGLGLRVGLVPTTVSHV